MRARARVAAAVVFGLLGALASASQQPSPSPSPAATPAPEPKPEEEGFPITNAAVKEACGFCHKPDDKGLMTRISFRRTTPEGWQQTIRRMVALNGAPLEAEKAREVLRYLANNLGLAPEEAKPGAFEVERRMIDYKYTDKETEQVCSKCHSMGRVLLERRTKEEWELLIAMHRGFYPLSDFQAFRRLEPRRTTPGADGRPPDNRHPMEKALAHLVPTFLLRTPEWSAWSANVRPPRLEGRWALSGYQPGKGPVYGEVRIAAKPGAPDEFTTETRYAPARGGAAVQRQGQAIVYTGFQWRGRSTASAVAGTPESLREVMSVERDWKQIAGRWFTGGYDETGLDVTLSRIGSDPVVLGVMPIALKTGVAAQSVKIHGANLPASLKPADVDFGKGVRVTRVVSAAGDVAAVEVDVDNDAATGPRDVFVAGASRSAAAVVYRTVDAIKITPQAGMARVGGVNFPKGFQQFEAVAVSNGPDGKPDTKDDLSLGVVDAQWGIEEWNATYADDDKDFVGKLDAATGLFTPAEEGPNPKRSGNRNNVGDVWVVATLAADSPLKPGKLLRARAHLVVTVPLYMRWETKGVGQ
jgi:quinohemoprotein amine dehydrogenase